MRGLFIAAVGGMVGLMGGCRKPWVEAPTSNTPPETRLWVDTIARSGTDRLPTKVSLYWYGTDPDGFVRGYEWAAGDTSQWRFTTATDTTLLFTLPPGADTADVMFWVRSIDNEGAADPSPARLRLPLKNSPPEVRFVYPRPGATEKARYPSSTFPVLVFSWEADDPDGVEQIDSFRVYLNSLSGPYISVPAGIHQLTLEAVTPDRMRSHCRFYFGNDEVPAGESPVEMVLDDTNRAIIVAVDAVGAASPPDTSRPVLLWRVNRPYLWVNGYTTALAFYDNFWRGRLHQQGLSEIPTLRLAAHAHNYYLHLQPTNFAQALVFRMFDYIFWGGNDAAFSLALGQKTLGPFLENGGKIYQALSFAYDADPRAGYFEIMPVDSLVQTQGTFTLAKDSLVTPRTPGWPVLQATKIISSARPFHTHSQATPLYDAHLVVIKDFQSHRWTGPSTVMARRTYPSGGVYLFSSVLPEHLDGRANIDSLFDRIVHDEFQIP